MIQGWGEIYRWPVSNMMSSTYSLIFTSHSMTEERRQHQNRSNHFSLCTFTVETFRSRRRLTFPSVFRSIVNQTFFHPKQSLSLYRAFYRAQIINVFWWWRKENRGFSLCRLMQNQSRFMHHIASHMTSRLANASWGQVMFNQHYLTSIVTILREEF